MIAALERSNAEMTAPSSLILEQNRVFRVDSVAPGKIPKTRPNRETTSPQRLGGLDAVPQRSGRWGLRLAGGGFAILRRAPISQATS